MFKLNLSDEQEAAIERERIEALRLYRLTDLWLANALLGLARTAQRMSPEYFVGQHTYPAELIWGIVPEIAHRLGPVRIHPAEISVELRNLSTYELRVRAGHCLQNTRSSDLPGWVMLTRELANGNPVVYGLDRLHPGVSGDKEDPIVCRLAELAAYRQKSFNGVWTPGMYL